MTNGNISSWIIAMYNVQPRVGVRVNGMVGAGREGGIMQGFGALYIG